MSKQVMYTELSFISHYFSIFIINLLKYKPIIHNLFGSIFLFIIITIKKPDLFSIVYTSLNQFSFFN